MPRKSSNPRLNSRLGVRKEFPQGSFNGVIKRFDSTTGYYQVKYEDGDSEEMLEDEAFGAARAYRVYLRHKDAIDSVAMFQITVPMKTTRRKAAKGVQSSVHTIPAEENPSPSVACTGLTTTQARKERIIEICATILFLWGPVHLAYTFVARFTGKN